MEGRVALAAGTVEAKALAAWPGVQWVLNTCT